jgi:hypothetical protein
MEIALYIIIGTMSTLSLISIPIIIYLLYDNKRREQEKGATTQ